MNNLNQNPLFDKVAAGYVFGTIMHEPHLLSLNDKYLLNEDDFIGKLNKIIFGAIYNLSHKGAEKITPLDVDVYLASYDVQHQTFVNDGGKDYLDNVYALTEEFSMATFEFQYERVKKFSTLRELRSKGIDVSEFYNPSFINQVEEENRFNALTIEQILSKVRDKVQLVENHNLAIRTEGKYAFEGVKDLLNSFKVIPELGFRLEGDIFNYATRGARLGKLYMYSAPSGGGKALPNSVIIPMYDGSWKSVGEISVGDVLIDRLGNPTKVLQIFPQGKRDVYKVTFKDGRTALCNNEHLWSYNILKQKSNRFYTKTLQEIIDEGVKTGYKNSDGAFKFLVPINEPIQYSKKDLKIDPYLLGLMIGDGSFRQNTSNKSIQFSTKDIELVNTIVKITGWIPKKGSVNNYTYYFADKESGKNIFVEDFLSDYPELINDYSYDKSIPTDFLHSSIEDRWSLLQGLMDTDGSVDVKGRCSFCSTSKKLIENVKQLIFSLGMRCTVGIDKRDKYTEGCCYKLCITAQPEKKLKMFRLSRKLQRVQEYLSSTKRFEKNTHNAIVNIEKLDYQEEMTCFYVDNDEHLFLMNDYIVTHNTRTMVGNACSIAFPRIENGYVCEPEELQPVLFVATEMQPDEIQTLILAWISGVNEEKILLNTCTDDELMLIDKAVYIMEKYKTNFIIENISDPTVQSVKSVITNHIITNNIQYIFYDYIFTSPGLMAEFKASNLREDVVLMMLSNTLKEIAAEKNVFIMTASQLNGDWAKTTIRNANTLRGAKSLADKIDCGMIGVRGVKEEVEHVIPYCESKGYPVPNMVIDIYKNRRGKLCDVKIFRLFDYGTCRTKDIVVTTNSTYEVIDDRFIFGYQIKRTEVQKYV